jgi:hypothetical protein
MLPGLEVSVFSLQLSEILVVFPFRFPLLLNGVQLQEGLTLHGIKAVKGTASRDRLCGACCEIKGKDSRETCLK